MDMTSTDITGEVSSSPQDIEKKCCDRCDQTQSFRDCEDCSCHTTQEKTVEGWEQEFDKEISELDNPHYLDNANGDVARFGYKTETDNGWIYTIPDWGNVKEFIRSTREEAKREERVRLETHAKEYKDKGFELETFIYSGFIPPHQ